MMKPNIEVEYHSNSSASRDLEDKLPQPVTGHTERAHATSTVSYSCYGTCPHSK